jgi:prepilin-type N-terminal cleavage/methylation domain-containing protein
MFDRIKNTDGFTLVELMMVVIILGILSQMALTFALDIRKRAYDATALTDGKNLMSFVGNSFLALEDVTFEHTAADGREVGVLAADGTTPRTTPIFTLSPGVRAEIIHDDPEIPSGGYVEARVYHINGTSDATSSGKREFWFSIDEMTSFISAPTL